MDVKDVIRGSFGRSQMVTTMLCSDLTDSDIMQRPVPKANHIAWQLGHLVSSLNHFGESVKSGAMPPLPEGLSDNHNKESASSDDPAIFLKKDEYIKLLDQQREAMLNLLGTLSDEEMLAESPEQLRDIAPTVIDMISLAAEHEMMHSGQISVLRRKLGKPVTI